MANEACFLYLIGPTEGPQKIGRSMAPAKRLKQLQADADRPLFLFGKWPVGMGIAFAVERYAQWILRDKLFRGEWFNVSRSEAVQAIEKAIKASHELRPYDLIPPVDLGSRPYYHERVITKYPVGTLGRIDNLVGKGDRSVFIREAIEAELKRREGSR